MSRYVFYDLETSGLNPCFDQIFEYAAVTTDSAGKVLDEVSYAIALRPDVIPAPQAVLTHQLPIFSNEHTMTELAAVQAIHQQFNQPNTISLGYNTLSFDDIFLRFAFYRHLLPPYQHQYAKGCYRMDIYPMLVFYFLYQPEVIAWPLINEKHSLKLEHLNAENQWTEGPAHHALVDVKATVKLAQALQQQQKIWDYLQGFFNPSIDAKRTQSLPVAIELNEQVIRWGLLIDPSCGVRDAFQVPVLCLGHHKQYKKQMVLLRLDLPLSDVIETAWVIRKKYGEPGFLLPPKDVYLMKLSAERMDRVKANIDFLKNHVTFLEAMIHYHCHWEYPWVPNVDVDAGLYQMGFYSDDALRWCESFHQASSENKVALLTQVRDDAYLYPLGLRLMGRYFPEYLPEPMVCAFQDYLDQVFHAGPDLALRDYKGGTRLTASAAYEAASLLLANETVEVRRTLLQSLQYYLSGKMSVTTI